MKGIKTLIRVQKKELDERARKKTELEVHILRLQANINQLQDELEREQGLVANMPEMAFSFVHYAENNKKRREELGKTISNIQRQVFAIEEEIRQQFGELKKYEIALEQKIKALEQEEKLREDKLLDDIAANRHRRKGEE